MTSIYAQGVNTVETNDAPLVRLVAHFDSFLTVDLHDDTTDTLAAYNEGESTLFFLAQLEQLSKASRQGRIMAWSSLSGGGTLGGRLFLRLGRHMEESKTKCADEHHYTHQLADVWRHHRKGPFEGKSLRHDEHPTMDLPRMSKAHSAKRGGLLLWLSGVVSSSLSLRERERGSVVDTHHTSARLVAAADPRLYAHLQRLARAQRLVFFAGLPGTGKSFLSHQLAHLAHAMGRTVHMLQWDVARPGFEASPAGQRYPVVHGVTHSVIRQAAGLWARHASVQWQQHYPEPHHLLIGETPFVGQRFLELARPRADAAEPLLRAASCCFVVPVPSRAVRDCLEAERQRRSVRPLHQQEREDAPPQVLRDLWRHVASIAPLLGLPPAAGTPEPHVPYDPTLYQQVYQLLLRHRQSLVIPLEIMLPTATLSVYDFAVPRYDVVPTAAEVIRFIREVEQQYPDLDVLQREIDRWYLLP